MLGENFIAQQKRHLQPRGPGIRLGAEDEPFAEPSELRITQRVLRHYDTVDVAPRGVERRLRERAVKIDSDQVPSQKNRKPRHKIAEESR